MKRIFIVSFIVSNLMLFAFCFTALQGKEKPKKNPKKIVSASEEHWPPYIFEKEAGKPITGYSYEILKEVYKNLGIQFEVEQYPWKRCVKNVFSGTVDALFSASKKSDREQYCHYSKEPLFYSQYVLFIRKEDKGKLKFENFSNLEKYQTGITLGYSYSQEFLDFLKSKKHKKPIYQIAESDINNFKKLMRKRIDFFIVELGNGVWLSKQLNIQDKVVYLKKPVLKKPYFMIFNKEKIEKSFVDEKFTPELIKFKKTKHFQEIKKKYLEVK